MKRESAFRLLGLGILVLALARVAAAQETITQAELLRRVIDVQRLATPPPPGERTRLFSSYDRRSQAGAAGEIAGWGANEDHGQFSGVTPDGWQVLAEVDGPGAITRMWSADPGGHIRFVLDGEPVIEAAFNELLSGRVPPFETPLVERGMTCHFPVGFSRSCQVLARECSSYYQINVVCYPPGTTVTRFRSELDEEADAALAEVRQALSDGLTEGQLFGGQRMRPVAVQQELGPGETISESLSGAGTVRALYVALTDQRGPRDLYALRRCLLRVYADGEETPAIEAPLCDFFGAGFDLVAYNSLVLGTDRELSVPLPDRRRGENRYMYCLFPMPFRDGLRVEIENGNSAKRKIGLMLLMQADPRPPAPDALRFHARFRREDPCQGRDYALLEARGRGRLVGCVLSVDCPRAAWWGEGDDQVWIDGERFPSYFGTGTADFFDDAGGLHAGVRPFAGVTRTGPYGKFATYRWQLADAIAFQKSVRFTLENLQAGGARDTYYSSVVYWYATAGATSFFKPLKVADVEPPGLRIPGAVECEERIVGTGWGNVVKQKYAEGVEFSGAAAAHIATTEPVRMILPGRAAQTVRLKLRVHPRRAFETITVTDGTGTQIGVVTYDRAADGMYAVGTVNLEAGENALTVECTRPATLDCWVVEPLGEGPGVDGGP